MFFASFAAFTVASHLRSRIYRHRLRIAAVAIVVLGVFAGWWGMLREERSCITALVHDAQRGAAILSAEEMVQLSGTEADLDRSVYADVKARLVRYRGADPLVRFMSILRVRPPNGEVVFLVDSEPEDSPDVSLPGENYPEAADLPGLQQLLKDGLPGNEEVVEDKFGTWVTGYAVVARDASGEVSEVLGIDVTASDWQGKIRMAGYKSAVLVWLLLGLPLGGYVMLRRQHEQREVIRNLSEAIEQSHTAVMIIDLKGRIEYANRGFCQQIKEERRALMGRQWKDFLERTMPPDVAADIQSAIQARQNWNGEWENRRKDGSTYPVRGIVTAVKTRQDEVTCYVAVYEDQTEMRQSETVLREAKEHAEAGDRAKSQFLATMSHEVRTPLNGIVGFTNLLLETPLDDEQEEYMKTIRTSGESLIQLTNDILDYARIESGNLQLELQPCDPRECVEEALDLLATRASAKKIEMLHWVDDGVPTYVQTDPGRLRQVLINLVNNAVKFTEVGEVAVNLSARKLNEAQGDKLAEWELTFSVRDTGIGIDDKTHGRLFHPFSQLEDSTTRRYGGTGLGLAISRNLVELMGGKIGLESEPDVGSIFTFTIKAEEVLEVDEAPRATAPSINGVRLAVAAQRGELRNELTRLATRWGAQVEGMLPEELSAKVWDMALVDLPDIQATDLSKLHEQRVGYPKEKMVALVALGLPPEVRTGLRPHFRALINKPAHHEALRVALAAPAPSPKSARPFAVNNSFDLRVLLVEDNPVNQRLMQKVLATLGCSWTVAENGLIALEELERTDFHLVLMDLHMPVMDGPTAISKIRSGDVGPSMQNVWISALTADARSEQKERVLKAGANDYLVKPVRLQDLRKMLQRYIAWSEKN